MLCVLESGPPVPLDAEVSAGSGSGSGEGGSGASKVGSSAGSRATTPALACFRFGPSSAAAGVTAPDHKMATPAAVRIPAGMVT